MIKVLDSFVADKIAAGEVIERPVSAVKELIENSIDAGADSIIVEIRGGGKSYIRVTDNGCGIAADEAEIAFLRHATSKISSVADLDRIGTLGFRGEALASIAAVSRLTLVTRTSDSAFGLKLVMHGGKLLSNERTGANPGTSMIVEDLFYNTPARRKFMKSDAREASAIIELVQQFAVYYAGIRFMMISNGQTLFTTAGNSDVMSVIKTMYPDLASKPLIAIDADRVKGYVSDPGNTRNSRRGQLFFVNGRLVSSSVLERGLEEGYGGRIFSGFPVAILFIDADPSEIDVNIHPGKREIRFLKQEEVRKAVSDAVNKAVMTEAGVPGASISEKKNTLPYEYEVMADQTEQELTPMPFSQNSPGHSSVQGTAQKPEQTSIKEYLKGLERNTAAEKSLDRTSDMPTDVSDASEAYHAVSSHEKADTSFKKSMPKPFDFSEIELKGYVFDTYIIMQSRDALYIFDQHAAHERVFYEKFMAGYKNKSHLPQPILTAFTINVSADVYCMDRSWLEDLKGMGYDIEDFGERSFIVRGVPSYMSLEEADGFVRGYIDAIEDAKGINDIVTAKLIMKSCKSAVKANDRLSDSEIKELMQKLSECDNPFSCPHGRPTFIKMTRYDIERSFRRK